MFLLTVYGLVILIGILNNVTMETGTKDQWDRFARLGDMIGDGLHHEPDGKWITREYKRLYKILCPQTEEEKEAEKEFRKAINKNIDTQISLLLKEKRCACGGELKQARSGSKICYCSICNTRYKAKSKNK